MTGLRALLHQLDRYQQEFDYIASQKRNYSPWQVAVGGGLACGGFCIQFGCDWTAFFYAALAAIMGLRLRMYLNEKGSNAYVNIGIAAFVSTLLPQAFPEDFLGGWMDSDLAGRQCRELLYQREVISPLRAEIGVSNVIKAFKTVRPILPYIGRRIRLFFLKRTGYRTQVAILKKKGYV
jgi:hypothetical protein